MEKLLSCLLLNQVVRIAITGFYTTHHEHGLGSGGILHVFNTLESEGLVSRPGLFTSVISSVGKWLCVITGLDMMAKIAITAPAWNRTTVV